MTWSLVRIEAHDRHRAAMHEAGHFVIARKVGVINPRASISRRSDFSDVFQEKTWSGKCSFPFGLRALNGEDLSLYNSVMIGVAGWIAEEGGAYDEEEDWYVPENMSPTDWKTANCLPGEPNETLFRAASRVHDLLSGELRADLYEAARLLILDARGSRREA